MKKSMIVIIGIISIFLFISCSNIKTVQTNSITSENENNIQKNLTLVNKDTENVNDFSVITIGTGMPEFSNEKANSGSMIKYNDKYYIVDCGDGVYANLVEVNFDFTKIGGIFFTHHHIDHTTDFFDIYVKCMMSNNKISVVGPPRTQKFIDFVSDVYLDDILYRKYNAKKNNENIKNIILGNQADVIEIIGEKQIEIDGLTITTAEMTHTMYDLAYRFEVDGKSIVISGDTSYDEDLITLSKNADILVIDGTLYKENISADIVKKQTVEPFYEYGANLAVVPHFNFEDMVKVAIEANVEKLVITHYKDATDEIINSSIEKIKESFEGEVIYANDMMEIEVNDVSLKTELVEKNVDLKISYPIVDTGQTDFYSDVSKINEPTFNDSFYGQDATYIGNQPTYTDNEDGTVTDNVTGLMWAQDMGQKMTFEQAKIYADSYEIGGYDNWRIPTIKELYSLIQFTGQVEGDTSTENLFIDTNYFVQPLGDISKGEREIDAQVWSSTVYVGKTMKSDETIFGVNFIDGRIKGYPKFNNRTSSENQMYFRLVRGNEDYGNNNFIDNENGTITDLATDLTWQQDDSLIGMNWEIHIIGQVPHILMVKTHIVMLYILHLAKLLVK